MPEARRPRRQGLDWDSTCGGDCGKDSGKFTLCSDCAAAWCSSCIAKTANDVGATWRCPQCQAAADARRHNHTDVQLEDDERIVEELLNAARVVGFKPGAVAELTDEQSHPGGGDAAAIEDHYGSMYVRDLRALLRGRKLSDKGGIGDLVQRLRGDDERMKAGGGDDDDDDDDDDDADEAARRAREGLQARLKEVLRKYREARAH